jgi:pseudooxynicotine oxidase
MEPAVDVVVIGGDLAGLTAARELGRRGRKVLLLEARERLGGRAWVSSFAGIDVEMGGTFVHRSQPHLWADVAGGRASYMDGAIGTGLRAGREIEAILP